MHDNTIELRIIIIINYFHTITQDQGYRMDCNGLQQPRAMHILSVMSIVHTYQCLVHVFTMQVNSAQMV